MVSTTTLKSLLAVSTLAAASLLGSCGSSDTTATADPAAEVNESFERYKNQFIDSLWYYNPRLASAKGNHRYDSLLVIPTAARREVEAAAQTRMRKSLTGFKVNDLSANNQTDYHLLLNYLDKSRFYSDTLRSWSWDPSSYNLGASVAEILNGRYYPLDRRLRAISIKIDHAPDYYEAAQTNIERPTREHTELAILQNEGGLQVFGPALQDSIKRSGLDAREKKELQDRIATTRLVIENYLKFLRGEVLAGGKFRSFRLGKELFDRKFALDIQSAYSADQVYQKAQDNRAYLLRDMGRRAARLWPKYFAGQPMPTDSVAMIQRVISRLSEKHATKEGFVEAVKAQIPVLIKFVNDKKLLTQDPSKPLVVRETPLYMRGSGAGASISAPGPYDKAANTYYNVEPLDNLTPAQAESYLREYNDYTLQILNIHEAIPGHYTQLVYANRSPSLVKAIFGNGAMVEGWAVYAERMMLESGYGQNSDEIWLMWDKWNMRVTLNTILDHEVHVGNISREAALKMLQRDGFQEESETTNKWRRATLSQVQLSSYFSGYTAIYDLREELKKELGANLTSNPLTSSF
ncbi:DUF885 domain-containing protein [Hymenobacter qilianensis]|uniref:DUF885 domain-containing protein n=1 Tax=Hymenobacter qilianensis TaxID=1385715 RepID=UPI001CB9041B|nr:DUF885 domain-containing protein [Hymenobacter qilianensis]